jgi:hypothetical protein
MEMVMRLALAPSIHDRCNVSDFGNREAERAALLTHDHPGAIVMASVWLAFYVIGVIIHFIASGN